MKKKVLVLGASGYLGSEIVKQVSDGFELYLGSRTQIEGSFIKVDLIDYNSVKTALEKINPDVVIHVARLGDFDRDPIMARKITDNLCELVKKSSARLIYISSDAVFDGEKGDYNEDDKTNPTTDYGKAKLAAENVVELSLEDYVIIRAGYIYGEGAGVGDKRTRKLLEEAKGGIAIKRFNDMYRTPIHVTKLAQVIWKLAKLDFSGVIHIGEGRESVLEFSKSRLKESGLDPSLVEPDSLKDKGLNIAIDTSLNTSLAQKILQ